MQKMSDDDFTTCFYDETKNECYKKIPNETIEASDARQYDTSDLNVLKKY